MARSVPSINVEDAYVCVEEEERIDGNTMSVAHCIAENVQDEPANVAEALPECDLELREQYKQLLVQTMVERIKRKTPEVVMWREIENETGFNHKVEWDEVRETTIKKIMSLLPADDMLENISMEMRLTPNDWLLFDVILVHDQINVLNTDPLMTPSDPTLGCQGNAMNNMEEPPCLLQLFELVKQYNIENLVGEALAESWTRLTLQYNSWGRQCSPMLLQLRWYQMKERVRSRFYNSNVYNKNQDAQTNMQSNVVHELTALQNAIAVAYNTIITEEYPTWETLIEQERVILPQKLMLINIDNNEYMTDSCKAPIPSNEPLDVLINVHENQICKKGNNIVTEDSVLFDPKIDMIDDEAIEESDEQFELRLIREVAKTIGLREEHVWQKLSEQMGRDCKDMWYQMRNATAEKVSNLFAVNDVIDQDGSARMQLSATEWLLFDLVLVHEKINVFNYDTMESKCLRDLFELVQEYEVENHIGEDLVESWINVTLKYNTGGRQCSPMLLQLCWYQLKELTRRKIYDPSLLSKLTNTKILIAIAAKYQKIIPKELSEWNTLIQNKSVILPEEFITIIQQKKKWTVLEPREVWYLHVKEVTGHCDTVVGINDIAEIGIGIVPSVAQSDNVDKFNEILEQTPKDPKQSTMSKLKETKEPETIELDSDDEINEILRETVNNLLKISQGNEKNIFNMPTILSGSDAINKNIINKKSMNCDSADETVLKPVTKTSINNNESISDSDDKMDKLLEEQENLMSIELCRNPKTLEKLTETEVDEFTKPHNSNIYRTEVEESGIINREPIMTDKEYEVLNEVDFDTNNIEFVDDGIRFEEACEYNTRKDKSKTVFSSRGDDNSNAVVSKDENEIDWKLLINTTVYTKKIDCMEVFKFIDYNFVNDKRVIEYVQLESKPSKPTVTAEDIKSFREQTIMRYEKYSNRCDDYKALSKQLLNESTCSKRSDLKSAKANEMQNTDDHAAKITAPSIPDMLTGDQNKELAKHVQDRIVTMIADDHDKSDMSNVNPNLSPQRSKVINLPDKEKVRLINQSLLTAQVTPRQQSRLNLTTVSTKKSKKSKPDDHQSTINLAAVSTKKSKKSKPDDHQSTINLAAISTKKNKPDDHLSTINLAAVSTKKSNKSKPDDHQSTINLAAVNTKKSKKSKPDDHQSTINLAAVSTKKSKPGDHQSTVNSPAVNTKKRNKNEPRHKCTLNSPADNIKKSIKSAPGHQSSFNSPAVITKKRNKNEPGHQYLLNSPADNTKDYLLEMSPCKRFKKDIETSQPQSLNASYYCCWAREKIVHIDKKLNLECSQHTCPDNHCTCCCRRDLVKFTSENSYLQGTNMPSAKRPNLGQCQKSKVAVKRRLDVYSKPSVKVNTSVKTKPNITNLTKSASFSKHSDMLVSNNTQNNADVINGFVNTRITNSGDLVKKFKTDGASKSAMTPKSVSQNFKVLNYTLDTDTFLSNNCTETKASISPERSLSTTTIPDFLKITPRLVVKTPKTVSPDHIAIPSGVNFIELDNKLALAIHPSVTIQASELHSLMSVCALANKNTGNKSKKRKN